MCAMICIECLVVCAVHSGVSGGRADPQGLGADLQVPEADPLSPVSEGLQGPPLLQAPPQVVWQRGRQRMCLLCYEAFPDLQHQVLVVVVDWRGVGGRSVGGLEGCGWQIWWWSGGVWVADLLVDWRGVGGRCGGGLEGCGWQRSVGGGGLEGCGWQRSVGGLEGCGWQISVGGLEGCGWQRSVGGGGLEGCGWQRSVGGL